MSLGFLIIRLVVGLTLAAHGTQKLFGWFGGYGLAGTGQFFEQLGFRPGRLQAFQAGLAETGGGLLLAAGLFTPAAATLLVAVMLVAVVSVHLAHGFFAQNNGYEYPLVLAVVAVAVAISGPGALSLDHVLGLSMLKGVWGLAGLLAGLVGGSVPLILRNLRHDSPVQQEASAARTQ